jgi:Ca2+-binding EF-hand superfamily protein
MTPHIRLTARLHPPRIAKTIVWVLVLFTSLVAVLKLPAAEPAPTKESKRKGEAFDILYLSDARPVVMRIHVTLNGQSVQESWTQFADTLFTKLDSDKNGKIDEKEIANLRPMIRILSTQSGPILQNGRNGDVNFTPISQPMSQEEFRNYLKKNNLGPLQLPSGNIQQRINRFNRRQGMNNASYQALDKALMELLDTDKDGKISVAEFKAGIEILTRLDVDENELISVDEVLRRVQSPYYDFEEAQQMQRPQSPAVELLPLSRKGSDPALARQLLIRYGPKPANQPDMMDKFGRMRPMQQTEPKVRRLTKKDIKLSDAMFEAIDQDGDGELDSEELARFGQNATPEVEIALNLGSLAKETKTAEVILAGAAPLKVSATPRGSEIAIEVPGVRLDLMAPVGALNSANFKVNFRNRYLNRFKRIDTDGNGYVDKKEAENDPLFSELFSYFDKDGDGKIFEKELLAALNEVEEVAVAASNGVTMIDLSEAGQGLFGLIDADGDGMLSIPELRAMPKLVERFGKGKDGTLAPGDVPRRFEALVMPGLGMGRNVNAQFARMGGPNGQQRAQAGPLWFQKMDRNKDGYVSRREFLGTDEEFQKLDLDGDGLISVQEAEAATPKAPTPEK